MLRKVYNKESRTVIKKQLDEISIEALKEHPDATIKKLNLFVLKFGGENGGFPRNIPTLIQNKIAEFKQVFPTGGRNAWLSLIDIMVIERLDHIRNKHARITDNFNKLHAEHPEYLRGYNYHAGFLLKHLRYADCKEILLECLSKKCINQKDNRKQVQIAQSNLAIVQRNLETLQNTKQESKQDTPKPTRSSLIRAEMLRRERLHSARRARALKAVEQKRKLEQIVQRNKERKEKLEAKKQTLLRPENPFSLLASLGSQDDVRFPVAESIPSIANNPVTMFNQHKRRKPVAEPAAMKKTGYKPF